MALLESSYAGLANLVASKPEYLILRRFSSLNAKSLLYLQAELAHIEVELAELEDADTRSPARKDYNKNWATLSEATREQQASKDAGDLAAYKLSKETAQWKKVLEMRQILDRYNSALIQQSQIALLSSPHKNDLRVLRKWLDEPDFGNMFLRDSIEDVWQEHKHKDDYVAFQTSGGISYEIARLFLWIWRRCSYYFSHQQNAVSSRLYDVDGSADGRIGKAVALMFASVIPLVPIIALYAIGPKIWIRIGVIIGFTAGFALLLVFWARLKPDQLLVVTLALAALQVIYVGSTS